MKYLLLILLFAGCNVYEPPQTIEVTGTIVTVGEDYYDIFINEPKDIWDSDFIRIEKTQDIQRGFVCKFDVYVENDSIKIYGELRCFDPVPTL